MLGGGGERGKEGREGGDEGVGGCSSLAFWQVIAVDILFVIARGPGCLGQCGGQMWGVPGGDVIVSRANTCSEKGGFLPLS